MNAMACHGEDEQITYYTSISACLRANEHETQETRKQNERTAVVWMGLFQGVGDLPATHSRQNPGAESVKERAKRLHETWTIRARIESGTYQHEKGTS